MRKRCKALKADGEKCRTFVLKDEDYCVWHSQSERAIRARQKKPVLPSNFELAEILTKELNRVRKLSPKTNRLKKAQEVRKLIQLIVELAPNKKEEVVAIDDGEKKDTFQEKVAKAKRRKQKSK